MSSLIWQQTGLAGSSHEKVLLQVSASAAPALLAATNQRRMPIGEGRGAGVEVNDVEI